ncbi:MAG: DNA recombination protein RmuC [Bacteroidia bacterium]|nr:DNA recombination protein RmuC [Bacteroidia bacterium]
MEVWLIGIMGFLGGVVIASLIVYLYFQERVGKEKRLQVQLESEKRLLTDQYHKLESQYGQSKADQIDYQSQILDLTSELSRMKESYSQLSHQMDNRQKDLGQLQQSFRLEFESLARNILERNSKKLASDNQFQLHHLLQPLKDRIEDFEKRVENTYQKEARERFSLQREIEKLVGLNLQMSEEARNLTRALKGDKKLQGNWGEMILSKILESSGLREGHEFVVQGKNMDLKSHDGRRLQPDVVICLPENKHLIVDSKVSLVAYEKLIHAESEARREALLKQHLDAVQIHINQLSEKRYDDLEGVNSPEFTLLFMPIEPAFNLALQHKTDLFSYAWDKKIILVGPTTLSATLRTVASLWKLEQQNEYAQEIARQGGALYDKFVGYVNEMEKIGASLEKAQRSYHDAMLKLKDGQGSLSSRAEKLRLLGIKNRKELS